MQYYKYDIPLLSPALATTSVTLLMPESKTSTRRNHVMRKVISNLNGRSRYFKMGKNIIMMAGLISNSSVPSKSPQQKMQLQAVCTQITVGVQKKRITETHCSAQL